MIPSTHLLQLMFIIPQKYVKTSLPKVVVGGKQSKESKHQPKEDSEIQDLENGGQDTVDDETIQRPVRIH